jgi:SAM-dependent methyltransferase
MLLKPEQREKLDGGNDRDFYGVPRLVTHVDDAFIARLTQLYRDRLNPSMRIFDMMSSWVSHLPAEMSFVEVVGHGMNAEELRKNPRLDRHFVQNLNVDLQLPLEDEYFDAVVNVVSVQYLQYPETIFAEVYRILKPGGIAIFSFSNRMFYQKAIAAWRDATEMERVKLVEKYFRSVEGFSKPEVVIERSNLPPVWQMLGLGGGDPFYAVISQKIPPSS